MKEPAKASSERLAKTSFLLLCLLRTEGGKRERKSVCVKLFICSLLSDCLNSCFSMNTSVCQLLMYYEQWITAPTTSFNPSEAGSFMSLIHIPK